MTVAISSAAAAVALLAQAVAVIAFIVRVEARVRALERWRDEDRADEHAWRSRVDEKLDRLAADLNRLIGATQGHDRLRAPRAQ